MFLTTLPLLVCLQSDILIYNLGPKIVKNTDGDTHRMVLAKCEVGVEVPNMSGGLESIAVVLNFQTVSYFVIGRNEIR
jgi:endo-1,4-beta-mannosidase